MQASAGWYGDHTVDVTTDGVTVRKGLDLDTLALPALKFEIRSERDDPVGVRVVDRLPAGIDANRVGVHADFAADQWTAFEDGRVTFTTRIDPDRPVVTLYGIWIDDPSRVHELLGSPEVKVVTDPNAPSLDPIGDAVRLPTVDNSLRSVGPDALVDLRADVEAALTNARAEPAASASERAASGVDADDVDDPERTMGDHAWAYPVERRGTGRIAAPTHADLDALVEDDVGEDHVYLRAALTETHHGGGGALLLQELANAFRVVARRVTGDAKRATVDAVVETPLGTDAVLRALADREQVTDSLVSPLVGDPDDATGIDAEPAEDTEVAARDGATELSVEPDNEDVEVVLNADGERFSELKAELDAETDTDALEEELADLDLPGVETSEEPSIDDLVDGDDVFDAEGDDAFVPASVEDDEALALDDDPAEATGLDFATDSDATDGDATDGDAPALDFETNADGADVDAADADAAADVFDLGEAAGEDETFDANGGETGDAEPETESHDVQFEFADEPERVESATEMESWPADEERGDDHDDPLEGPGDGDSLEGSGDGDSLEGPGDGDSLEGSGDGDSLEGSGDGDSLEGPRDGDDDSVEGPRDGDDDSVEGPRDGDGSDGPATGDAVGDVVEVPARELAAIRTEMRELRDRVATLESDLAAVREELARERTTGSVPAVRGDGDSREAVDGVEDDD